MGCLWSRRFITCMWTKRWHLHEDPAVLAEGTRCKFSIFFEICIFYLVGYAMKIHIYYLQSRISFLFSTIIVIILVIFSLIFIFLVIFFFSVGAREVEALYELFRKLSCSITDDGLISKVNCSQIFKTSLFRHKRKM